MNEIISKRNALLAETVIKGLKSRNMTGWYAASREDALTIALGLIPGGSSRQSARTDPRRKLRHNGRRHERP